MAHQEVAARGCEGPTQPNKFDNVVNLSPGKTRARESFAEDRECSARCYEAIRPTGGAGAFFAPLSRTRNETPSNVALSWGTPLASR